MKITPLAFESLGVRSMAAFIETDQKILIDPGTSLGPKRFGLPPWKTEFDALHKTRASIQYYAKKADIVTISHFHHDHFTPFFIDRFLDSNPSYAREIYQDKKLFMKNPDSDINRSQQGRARKLLKDLKDINQDINFSDGETLKLGDTKLKFSKPLPHGVPESKMGFLVALTIIHDDEVVLHASDVQGPIYEESRNYILNEKPDTLILSGPPLYLAGYAFKEEDMEKANLNFTQLCRKIPKVVVDHHLLRDLKSMDFIKSVKDETNCELMVASQLMGKEPNLLEARRKEFYLE